jgi:arsenite-transporting ATPase
VRTILFTGKGGVGKTTLSAAMALRCAAMGKHTLVISTDVAHSLADAVGVPLVDEPRRVGEGPLWAAELDTGEELERTWGDIRRRISDALRREGVSAPVAGELAIMPGLDEILALVRIKRYQDEGRYDVLVIDSAPTGAAMRLLGAPDLQRWYTRNLLGFSRGVGRVLMPALRSLVKLPIDESLVQQQLGQLFDQIEALRALLTDGEQTSVRLVLNPEHLSIQETQRAFTYMSLFGLSVDAVFVNRILPDEVSDPFFARWKQDQAARLSQIRDTFAPLPVFEVPLMRQEVVGLEALEALSSSLFDGRDPVPPLADGRPLRFAMEGNRHILALRVAGVSAGAVELEKSGSELHIRLGRFRRSIVLPQYLSGLSPAWARVEGHELLIAFEEPS